MQDARDEQRPRNAECRGMEIDRASAFELQRLGKHRAHRTRPTHSMTASVRIRIARIRVEPVHGDPGGEARYQAQDQVSNESNW